MMINKEIYMTRFDNKQFDYNGEYLFYRVPGEELKRFVARFKRGGMVSFKKFLRDNFTVEEYFDLLENQDLSPGKILETKGYVSPKIAKILKMRGYPMTLEGMNKMIDDDIARRAA
jgi:hypothetical protein